MSEILVALGLGVILIIFAVLLVRWENRRLDRQFSALLKYRAVEMRHKEWMSENPSASYMEIENEWRRLTKEIYAPRN